MSWPLAEAARAKGETAMSPEGWGDCLSIRVLLAGQRAYRALLHKFEVIRRSSDDPVDLEDLALLSDLVSEQLEAVEARISVVRRLRL